MNELDLAKRKSLRGTRKRTDLIQKIVDGCSKLNLPIEVDLNKLHYGELMHLWISVQFWMIDSKANQPSSE